LSELQDGSSLPTLRDPVMLAAFEGWNDAGEAASGAVAHLQHVWQASPIAEFDPEAYHDFQVNRPVVSIEDGRRRLTWPTTRVYIASPPGAERDVVLVRGIEPSMRWRAFVAELLGIAEELGVSTLITLAALLADVPHTRPIPVSTTTEDTRLLDRLAIEPSRYEGPTGIVGVLHDAFSRSGLPTASLWAAVPGYTSQLPSPRAAMALVDRACTMMGTPAPTARLSEQVPDYDARVASLISDDEDLVTYVGRLEEMVDEMGDDDLDDDDEDEADDRLDETDPELLAAEVEQFLRERDSDA